MIGATGGGTTVASLLDIVTILGPALLALAGVWLGSRFARGREDRSWRRSQLVDACSNFISATSAVEQWATSDQFAARLATGQYPTDYKEDLQKLDTAVAVLIISTSERLSGLASEGNRHLRAYVCAKADHQADRPQGSAMQAARYKEALSAWNSGEKAVAVAKAKATWEETRATFLDTTRAQLDALK
jgi:hypothetical protein